MPGEGAAADPLDPHAIRDLLERVADWQLEHLEGQPWHWQNAVFYIGLLAAHEATGEARYLAAIEDVAEQLEWRPGPRYRHADDHAIAQVYLELHNRRGEARMIEPFRATIDRMMRNPPDWKKSHQVVDYWWSDALFMSPPALARLTRATGNERYLDFADQLWRQSFDLLWSDEQRLFYRDLRQRERSPEVFWSRGNAWVLAGLARTLDVVDPPAFSISAGERRASSERDSTSFYVEVFGKLAERIASIQPEDGLWRSDLLGQSPSAPGETSGTALFSYAMGWGVGAGLLPRDAYWPVIVKAWTGLSQSVDSRGRLGWVQKPGDAPARVGPGHTASYGAGAFLLAGSEVLKLEQRRVTDASGGPGVARSGRNEKPGVDESPGRPAL